MHCALLFLLFLVKCYLFFNAQLKILSFKKAFSIETMSYFYLFFQNLLHYYLCSDLHYYISTILSEGLCINTFVCSYGNVPLVCLFVYIFIKCTKRIQIALYKGPSFQEEIWLSWLLYTMVVLPVTQNHHFPNQILNSMLLSIMIK